MRGPFDGFWYECRQCGFLASNLASTVGEVCGDITIDEGSRREALKHLRHSNFERILDELVLLNVRKQAKLLDVGCAHGWFLQAAKRRGYRAIGIEPDSEVVTEAVNSGLDVIPGFFPRDLPPDCVFDVITFNDVFEHLRDPRGAADACFEHLTPGGLLVLTLPNNKGALFRIARALNMIRVVGPFDRLWQRGFPSPHISYFDPTSLASFLQSAGFQEIYRNRLSSVMQEGLWQRLRYDRRSSIFLSLIVYLALYLLRPVLTLLPPDISFQVFQRRHSRPETS